jgi:signal transduction histidine kinase
MKLVHDILSLAQIESHDVEVQTKPIDIGVIMRQVISQYEDQIIKKELEVDVQEITKPLIVAGDRESIFQVLDNLYTNAVRYTPQGGRINITIKEWNNFGAIEVKDTGIGIPKKYLGRIFERFYRVDKARSRELGGTGLGLSIVKHLVANMGGTIVVESEVGIVSKFTVSLPLAR